jgi:hypothetical protein
VPIFISRSGAARRKSGQAVELLLLLLANIE